MADLWNNVETFLILKSRNVIAYEIEWQNSI
jgi:hypothetical protein